MKFPKRGLLFLPVFALAVFMLSSGFLFVLAFTGQPIPRRDVGSVVTAPLFLGVLCAWMLGVWLVLDSLRFGGSTRGLIQLLAGFAIIWGGLTFVEWLIA